MTDMTLERSALPALRTQAFIGGSFVDAASGRTYEVENPATGATIAEVAEGGAEDVDRAVAAARRAAPGWAATPPAERKKILIRFADLIDQHAEDHERWPRLSRLTARIGPERAWLGWNCATAPRAAADIESPRDSRPRTSLRPRPSRIA